MSSMLNKLTRFAKSPDGRRAMTSLTRGTTAGGRGTGGRGRSTPGVPAGGGAGGMIGKLAGSLLGGRRR